MLCSNVHTVRTPFQSLCHSPKRYKKREIKINFSRLLIAESLHTSFRFFLVAKNWKNVISNTAADIQGTFCDVVWKHKTHNKTSVSYPFIKLFSAPLLNAKLLLLWWTKQIPDSSHLASTVHCFRAWTPHSNLDKKAFQGQGERQSSRSSGFDGSQSWNLDYWRQNFLTKTNFNV